VHHPDRVTKTIVFGTGKNVIRKTQLLDPTETLEERRIDDPLFPLGDWNKPIENIVNYSAFHSSTPPAPLSLAQIEVSCTLHLDRLSG
jgi:hypothetical protein